MQEWNEADHPRDEKGRFTENGGGTSASKNNEDKMQKRADILYPSMKENNKNNSISKDNIGLGNLNEYKTTNNKVLSKGKIEHNDMDLKNLSNNIDNSTFSDSASIKARDFIQKEEGFRENAYKDIAGIWTIGYGHTGNVKPGDKITKEEAEKLFAKDFQTHIMPLKDIKVPLSDNEKIALASFIYNFGPTKFKNSTLYKKLNEGDKYGAAKEFDRWIYADGKPTQGLINRRKREKELFLTSDEN